MTGEMRYCMVCGGRLKMKYLQSEGCDIPYCEGCGGFRFPVFSTAVSMVVLSPDREKYLLIQQYGTPFWRLTAGYINRGEDAEHAVRREIMEELGLISPPWLKAWTCTPTRRWTPGAGSAGRRRGRTSAPIPWPRHFWKDISKARTPGNRDTRRNNDGFERLP